MRFFCSPPLVLGISPRKILLHLRVATFPKPFEVPGDLPCPLIRRENMDQKLRITLRDLRQFIDFIEKLRKNLTTQDCTVTTNETLENV